MNGRTVLAVALISTSLVVAGCSGSSDSDSSGPKKSADNKATAKIVLAMSATSPTFPQVAVAKQLGYFEDAGVVVDIKNVGTGNVVPAVISGQADIGLAGLPGPMLPAGKGKETTVLFAQTLASAAAVVVGQPGATSVKSCKRLATTTVGTSGYGWAKYYQKALGVNWKIQTQATGGDARNLLISKQTDCVISSFGDLGAAIESGKVKLLIDPSKPEDRPAGFPAELAGGSLFGLKDNVKSKSASVVKFLTAFDRATKYVKANSPEDVANVIVKVKGWDVIDAKTTADSLRSFIQFIPDGEIRENTWSEQLKWIVGGGTPLAGGIEDPVWSYANRVDMSFLDRSRKSGK